MGPDWHLLTPLLAGLSRWLSGWLGQQYIDTEGLDTKDLETGSLDIRGLET